MIHMREFNSFELKNARFLVNKQVAYATIQITATGMKKSILDATVPVRAYFVEKKVHDFDKQLQGQEHKRYVRTFILNNFELIETRTSFYRPNTKKGDPRIWISKIDKFTSPDDIFSIISFKGDLYIINLTKVDIESVYLSKIENPIRDLINSINNMETSTSDELLGLIRDKMSDWIPTTVLADTGVGREVEKQLGIEMNDSKLADYKGIELKSKRIGSSTNSALFTNAPDWDLSKCKSTKEIVAKYGYYRDGNPNKTLQVTVTAQKPNPQGLALNVNWNEDWLEANSYDTILQANGTYKKIDDIAVWTLFHLHQRLTEKHHETFWIDVQTRIIQNREVFRVLSIEHTKNPILPQFDLLLDQGKIKLDLMLCRPSGHGDTYSFKIAKKDRPLLFPESEIYTINSI